MCVCFKQNSTHSSKVISPETSGKLAFLVFSRGGAVGSLCSQNQEMKKEWEDEGGREKMGRPNSAKTFICCV